MPLPKATVAVVLLAWSLLSGCTQGCNSVGATSGVTFDLRRITAGLTGHVRVHACVDQTCVSSVASAARGSLVAVDDPEIDGPRTVSVHLTIEDMSGHAVFDATSQIELHILQPNGPDCPPTAYAAAVVATTDGQLKQLPRP